MSSKYNFVKSCVVENNTVSVFLYGKEDKNCDGSCVKVNTCPVINDKCK